MNRTTILKGLAICSSVVLAGGFVAYRQRQARAANNDEEPVMPGSKSRVILPSSKNIDAVLANPDRQDASGDKILLPSSKRLEMPVFKLPADKKDPTLLPSSKGLTPGTGTSPINRDTIDGILDSREPPPDDESEKNEPEDKASGNGKVKTTLLPSSKIGAILTPKDVTEKEKDEPVPDPEEKNEP